MNTRQLQYVLTVAEERSFSAAAEKLMISQPSLSQFMQKLEGELGANLFERTVPLSLTQAGKLYVQMARKMLVEEAEFRERVLDMHKGLAGTLRIGSGYLNSISTLPHLIAKYQENYPNVQIELIEQSEANLKLIADEGKLDLIVSTSRFAEAVYEEIPLFVEPFLIAVPKKYGKLCEVDEEGAIGRIKSVTQLEGIPLVRLQKNTLMRELVDGLYEAKHMKMESPAECTTALAGYMLAKSGVGACFIPLSVYREDYSDKVNYYQIEEVRQRRIVSIYHHKAHYLNSMAREFIHVARESYKKANPKELMSS